MLRFSFISPSEAGALESPAFTQPTWLPVLAGRVNQDALGVQAALIAASPIDPAADRWTLREWERQPELEPEVYAWKKGIGGMTTCD